MGRRVAVVLALCFLVSLGPAAAQAQGSTKADCTITVTSRLSSGVTATTPTSGTHTTGGESGSIDCRGTLDGHRVTGTGTFGFDGMYTQITCLKDGAPLKGTYAMTVPTDAGPLHFTGSITDSRIGPLNQFALSHEGATFAGTGIMVPTKGDCVLTPVTEIAISMIGTFKG